MGFALADDLTPEPHEVADIGLELLFCESLRHGSNDQSALRRFHRINRLAQTLSLPVRTDPSRHADVVDGRHVDDVPTGQRDVAGYACALGSEWILGDLHDDFLAFAYDFANGGGARYAPGFPARRLAAVAAFRFTAAASASRLGLLDLVCVLRAGHLLGVLRAILVVEDLLGGAHFQTVVFGEVGAPRDVALEVVGTDQVLDVQERSALLPDVHKGRLHARKDAGDFAQIDVAYGGSAARSLRLKLGDDAVFDQRDARFSKLDVNDQQVLRHVPTFKYLTSRTDLTSLCVRGNGHLAWSIGSSTFLFGRKPDRKSDCPGCVRGKGAAPKPKTCVSGRELTKVRA